ncbi:2-phospho-L-lactate transferase [Anaerolineales bacterium HSG25]|nr:2-phospho-L-lactate transferase [Anaerolineales bacterium HSG25]
MTNNNIPNIVALAGGVGGAKLAYGLYKTVPADKLTLIINTGDDFEHLGLHISPDLDTVMYTLAELANPQTGWGVQDESWGLMQAMRRYGGPDWFDLGDQDLATHLLRTEWLRAGQSLNEVTAELCDRLSIGCTVLPMSNQPVRTLVDTSEGILPFQEYFVKRRSEPMVTGLTFAGAEQAEPLPSAVSTIQQADLIIVCPSNPLLSIDPILAVPTMRALLMEANCPKVGVSPIVGGAAIKGPAAKMMAELGLEVSPVGVARHLRDVLTGWVIDTIDADYTAELVSMGLTVQVTNTIMRTNEDKIRLTKEILDEYPAFER